MLPLFSVCKVVVKELEKGINDVDPKKVIDLGGRLEADGSRKVIKVRFMYFIDGHLWIGL